MQKLYRDTNSTFLAFTTRKLHVMIFPKGFLSSKIVIVTLLVAVCVNGFSQIGFKGDSYKAFKTSYYTSYNVDSTFVLNYFKNNRIIENDSLTVKSTNSAPVVYTWFYLDESGKPLTDFIKRDTSTTGSSVRALKQGGYQVNIHHSDKDTSCIAWVFFASKLAVNIDKSADGKVKEFSCTSFLLKSTVSIDTFHYADPASGEKIEFDETKLAKIAWSPNEGIRNPALPTVRVNDLYKPSKKDTRYTLSVTSIFGNSVSDNILYESVIPQANFTFQHIAIDAVTNSEVTTKWDDVASSDSLSALALVKFKNTSENAQKYTWILSDTLLGKYTPNPVRIDTIDSKFEPEYKYYIPRTYKPMLVAINTKLGCRDTVVYKPADETTADYKIKIANSFFLGLEGTMPNVFTPNGDGENDYFRPELRSIKSFHFYVYSRLGRKLYEYERGENDPIDLWPGWDGKIDGGGMVKPGVYYYVIQARGWDGVSYRTKRYSGVFSVYL